MVQGIKFYVVHGQNNVPFIKLTKRNAVWESCSTGRVCTETGVKILVHVVIANHTTQESEFIFLMTMFLLYSKGKIRNFKFN